MYKYHSGSPRKHCYRYIHDKVCKIGNNTLMKFYSSLKNMSLIRSVKLETQHMFMSLWVEFMDNIIISKIYWSLKISIANACASILQDMFLIRSVRLETQHMFISLWVEFVDNIMIWKIYLSLKISIAKACASILLDVAMVRSIKLSTWH